MQTDAMTSWGSWAAGRRRGVWGDLWVRLARALPHSEQIEVCAHRYGYQPGRFRWQGKLLGVGRVERVWERAGRGQRNPRRYFRVLCQNDRTYILYQDLRLGCWYVEL